MTKTINVKDESKDRFRELHQLYSLESGKPITAMDFFEVILMTFRMHNDNCTTSLRQRSADKILRTDYEITS